jgi:predicted amidohydrolase
MTNQVHLEMGINILVVQSGPSTMNKDENIKSLIEFIEKECFKKNFDFILLPELVTTPYFCGEINPKYFEWAETIPGYTTERFSTLAKKLSTYIILPIFEKGDAGGEFFDSVAILDKEGNLISGVLPNGEKLKCYRKVHIPFSLNKPPEQSSSIEKFFFRPGSGFPIFQTSLARIGCLLCYDRSFFEGWRVLALMGAEIVFLPSATWPKRRLDTFISELKTAAVQNGIFVVACNKGGIERMEAERHFFGKSCIINPMGEVIIEAPEDIGPIAISATIDLNQIYTHNISYHYMRDRRPELYDLISKR